MHLSRCLWLLFTMMPALAAETPRPLEFAGVLVIGAEPRFALVASGGDHSGWIPLGATFAGWTLAEYRAAENVLVLQRDGHDARLPLRASVVGEAPSASAAKVTVAEVDEMLGTMRFEAMWDRIAAEQKKAMIGAMRQQAGAEFAKAGLPPAEIDALLNRMGDALVAGMQSDAMRKDFARIYAEVYTKDELRGMADFYDTTAGRAWVEKQPEVQQKLMEVLMPRVMQGMPAAQKIAADYLRQRATGAATEPARPTNPR